MAKYFFSSQEPARLYHSGGEYLSMRGGGGLDEYVLK